MTEPNRPVDIQRRIAAAQAARTTVDHNGNPKGDRTTYTYDERGLLVSAEPAPTTEA